jgi:serine/threonine protein kinase
MSPEQAKGLIADPRTDIFGLGAVLFEMLTGTQAFTGDTVGDVLAAVIRAEPDWRRLPPETPTGIRRLLRRCLQKNRNQRLQVAADVRIEIEEAHSDPDRYESIAEAHVEAASKTATHENAEFLGACWVKDSAEP